MNSTATFAVLAFTIAACSGRYHSITQKAGTDLPDSLFKYKNYKGWLRLSDFSDSLPAMDSLYRAILTDKIEPFNYANTVPYQAFFFAKQPAVDDFKVAIIGLRADDYGALQMLVIGDSNKVIDAKEIAGGFWGGPVETDTAVIIGETRYSNIVDERNINYYCIKEMFSTTDSSSFNAGRFYDSLSYKVVIGPDGKFSTIETDSVHYYKTLR